MITLLFKSVSILVDGHKMRRCYRANMAQLMAERYGKSPDVWAKSDEQIVSDWASYHADLNYSGEDGIVHIHEGLFRVTRALFKIAKVPEPTKSEITMLANELMSIPHKNVLMPDVLALIEKCQQKGYRVGAFSYLLEAQLKAVTAEINNLSHHIGADTLNHYEHDVMYFRKMRTHLKISPDTIIIVATSPQTIAAASKAGMQAILVRQSATSLEQTLTHILENET